MVDDALAVMLSREGALQGLAKPLAGFAAALAGWEFSDWVEGKLHVNDAKADHAAELARLQSYHGQAL